MSLSPQEVIQTLRKDVAPVLERSMEKGVMDFTVELDEVKAFMQTLTNFSIGLITVIAEYHNMSPQETLSLLVDAFEASAGKPNLRLIIPDRKSDS